jgi:large repetitive protein
MTRKMLHHVRLASVVLTLMVGMTLVPAPASAQLEATLNAQRFEPAPSYHSFMTVDTARLLPALGLGFDLNFDYAWRPLQVSTTDLERQYGMIDGLVGGRFGVGFGIAKWVEIRVMFPFMQATQVGSIGDLAGNRIHYSIGDITLSGRFRLLAEEKGVGIAVIPFVTFPTGRKDLFATRGTITFGARAAVSRHWKWVHFGAYAGYRMVPGSAIINDTVAVDDEISYGAGIGVSPVPDWLDINLELMGSGIIGPQRFNLPPRTLKDSIHSPLELHLNARLRTPIGLDVVVGGGPGLTPAVGTPGFRIYGGVSWAPPLAGEAEPVDDDPDGDRIFGDADQCPDVKEDKDQFEDEDGCPEPDNDGDGILDVDEADRTCINKPEDKDGFEDEDGCPDPDNDQDGNPDEKDECPLEPEDVDQFEDLDGCPDPDNDGDGITDDVDICPDHPEEFNDFKDEDGCPDEFKAVVKGEKIIILEKVLFVTDKDRIIKESYPLLDAVKDTLLANPGIKLIRIEGHTDSRGDDDHNLDLSNRRAQAVMKYLVDNGVDASRMEAVGKGETEPLVADDTDENMQKNRRVEFEILEQELQTVLEGQDVPTKE